MGEPQQCTIRLEVSADTKERSHEQAQELAAVLRDATAEGKVELERVGQAGKGKKGAELSEVATILLSFITAGGVGYVASCVNTWLKRRSVEIKLSVGSNHVTLPANGVSEENLLELVKLLSDANPASGSAKPTAAGE